MPKAAKRKAKEPITAEHEQPKPYNRSASAVPVTKHSHSQPEASSSVTRNGHTPIPSPLKNTSQPLPETKAKRRRSKKKQPAEEGATFPPSNGEFNATSNGAPEVEINGSAPSQSTRNGKALSSKHDEETLEAVRRRIFGPLANNTQAPAAPKAECAQPNKYEEEAMELRKKVANMTKAEEDAEQVAVELRQRVEELERTVATQKADIEKTQAEIKVKEQLIDDHCTTSDKLKEHLFCGVCFEALDDPHILSCGHCACRKCLQEWFRSPNAYPAADIEEVSMEDDLTFRTKVCHMCRERIFRRPTRMFIMADVVELSGLAHGVAAPESVPRDQDPWDKVFPPEPKAWLVRDEDDNVSRCPRCGCEVDYGECEQCGATFSAVHSDLDMSESDSDLRDNRIDLGNGLMIDQHEFLEQQLVQQGAALDQVREQMRVELDRLRNHAARGYEARLRDLIDDVAAAADDDDNDDDDDGTDYDMEDDDEGDYFGGRYSDDGDDHSQPHIDDSDADTPPPGSPDAIWSGNDDDGPLPAVPRHAVRPARSPSVVSDDSYDSSFIDDDASDDAIDALDASNDAGVGSDVDEVAGGGSDEEEGEEDVADEPTIDELRQRRAARYGVPPPVPRGRLAQASRSPSRESSREASASPPRRQVGRRRRARDPSPARSSSIEPVEAEPVRRARVPPRRIRVIDSDSE